MNDNGNIDPNGYGVPDVATKDDLEEVISVMEDLQGRVESLIDLRRPIPTMPINGEQVDVYQAIQSLIASIKKPTKSSTRLTGLLRRKAASHEQSIPHDHGTANAPQPPVRRLI